MELNSYLKIKTFTNLLADIVLSLLLPVKKSRELGNKANFNYGLKIVLFAYLVLVILYLPLEIVIIRTSLTDALEELNFLTSFNLLFSILVCPLGILMFMIMPFLLEILFIWISTIAESYKVDIGVLIGLLAPPFMGLYLLFTLISWVNIPFYEIGLIFIIVRPIYAFIFLGKVMKSKIRTIIPVLSIMIVEVPLYLFMSIASGF